jgi:hypothetical protein
METQENYMNKNQKVDKVEITTFLSMEKSNRVFKNLTTKFVLWFISERYINYPK